MTPEQKSFEAAIKERLAERARLLLATDQRTVALLRDALVQINQQLTAQPADWKLWQLTRLRDQLETVLTATGTLAGTAASLALRDAWQLGEDFVDKPLAVAGFNVEMRLQALDARVLAAMRTFSVDRMKDVTEVAAGKIAQQLGLVTIGGKTPFEAIKSVEAILGEESAKRATTIVHTEVSRAFAVAGNERVVQAAPLVPGLGKQWRRSGKIHSRWNHDLMDGQVVEAGKLFKVPNPGGGFDMMQCPHDPAAPVGQVIHCGCISIPWMKGWKVSTPGAKPFTERELKLDGRKAALDQAAKQAGRRREGPAR
ncbi:hypothetical protein [Hydrogenophaga sp.]|uniref:hypothetical protein n=1 Tax=Hydrogenophaga sp. TaxID=1904254 RepID=UPI002736519B|nr:hypothetical protein [Hydrogenophaga sp.]MDP3887027.1 hypothetical protein [Hydrogenophaga sp.]